MKKILASLFLILSLLATSVSSQLQAQNQGNSSPSPSRIWVSQQGTTLNARLVGIKNQQATLQNDKGVILQVPLDRLSAADQKFIATWAEENGIAIEAAPAPTASAPPRGSVELNSIQVPANTGVTWPSTTTVDTSALQVTNGEQDSAARRFVYQAGAFQFTSQAPLANTVMRQVARDFELVNLLFKRFPWGWESQPSDGGKFYYAELYETEADYIRAGGGDNTSGWSKGNLILTKFDSLGLKKVGGKYARDAKTDKDGSLVSLIIRLVIADMRGLCLPWSTMGMEEFIEQTAYRNGTFDFTNPERALKDRVEDVASWGAPSDVSRMVELLHRPWGETRQNSSDLRRQDFLDGMLLFYFFGYLDDDGKGTRLHQYYRNIAQETLGWRRYKQNRTPENRPHTKNGSMSDWAVEHNQLLIAGRSKEQLQKDILEKYKSIGLRLNAEAP